MKIIGSVRTFPSLELLQQQQEKSLHNGRDEDDKAAASTG